MSERGLFRLAAALLGAHLILWAASVLGIAWSRPLMLLLWLALAALAAKVVRDALRGARWLPPRPRHLAWLLVLGAFGALALASWLGWSVHPDWVFHWGPKSQRFALAGGIDVHYLTRPWNGHVHPDYPNLVPNLTASLALALGTAMTPALAATVTLVFAALWLAALRALAHRVAGGSTADAAWVVAAWCVTMFATGFRQAGGADLPFACAVTLGALALAAPLPGRHARVHLCDVHVAVAAALAAQTKLEGAPFALLLVALWLARRIGAAAPGVRSRTLLRAAAGAAVLPALVLAAWWAWNQHHGLFQASNVGSLALDRLPRVARGVWSGASERAWHGLPFLLLAWPWLLLRRDTRWPALLLLGQLAIYAGVYLATPVDLELLLLTSAARLLFHLVPAFLVLLVAALGLPARGLQASSPARAGAASASTPCSDEPVSPSFLA